MNDKEILRLLKMVEDADIASIEVKRLLWGGSVRIVKRDVASTNGHGTYTAENMIARGPSAAPPAPAPEPAGVSKPAPAETPADESTAGLVEVKAPMVGTFYRAPSPDADPYVQVGQRVDSGNVLCIIEAMKLMNEIEAESAGEIVKICVENAEPVEYGQVLLLIKP